MSGCLEQVTFKDRGALSQFPLQTALPEHFQLAVKLENPGNPPGCRFGVSDRGFLLIRTVLLAKQQVKSSAAHTGYRRGSLDPVIAGGILGGQPGERTDAAPQQSEEDFTGLLLRFEFFEKLPPERELLRHRLWTGRR